MSRVILYVDDEPIYVAPLVETLQDKGYIVEQAINWSDAVAKLQQFSTPPDLIILDLIMPYGDSRIAANGLRRTGLRLFEYLRKDLGIMAPILIVTVVNSQEIRDEVSKIDRTVGARGLSKVLIKPVRPSELLSSVNKMLLPN